MLSFSFHLRPLSTRIARRMLLRIESLIFVLMMFTTSAYDSPRLTEINSAKRLCKATRTIWQDPAVKSKCASCAKVGHFAKVCQNKEVKSTDVEESVQEENSGGSGDQGGVGPSTSLLHTNPLLTISRLVF